MRGRAFGFIAILCTVWVTARLGFTLMNDQNGYVTAPDDVSAGPYSQSVPNVAPPPPPNIALTRSRHSAAKTSGHILAQVQTNVESMAVGPNRKISFQVDMTPGAAVPDSLSSKALAFLPFAVPNTRRSIRPIEIYAYSFWRRGEAAQGALGNGQYGGGQSAMLMAIPLLRFPKRTVSRFAVIGRASVAHDNWHEREWSAGLRWQPLVSVPAHLSLEQRFRPDRRDAAAAFVSGGYDGAKLPLGFALDGYGQAGFVTGKSGGGFADIQLHALKPVVAHERATLTAGAGAWAGGQSDVMRVDIGPSARADLRLGATSLRLDASWRFRIAGNAKPGNGPAVTLSTSF